MNRDREAAERIVKDALRGFSECPAAGAKIIENAADAILALPVEGGVEEGMVLVPRAKLEAWLAGAEASGARGTYGSILAALSPTTLGGEK